MIEVLRRPVESTLHTAIRYAERLVEAGAQPSVGSVGHSYDNALAESVIGPYKTELIQRNRPWKTSEELELETLRWIDWYNHRRLHTACGNVPPAEFEITYYRDNVPDGTNEPSLS